MRVRYAESKQVKEMREKFEKAEKIALRSSKTYKVISKELSKFIQGLIVLYMSFCSSVVLLLYCNSFHFQTIAKSKRDKLTEISEMARRGGGESYIDSSRGIAVGMG